MRWDVSIPSCIVNSCRVICRFLRSLLSLKRAVLVMVCLQRRNSLQGSEVHDALICDMNVAPFPFRLQ